MRVEGQEKGGGVGEPSSLATQWTGDVPRPALFCREMGEFLCLVEFIAAVKNCSEVACGWWSESANWSRPAWALFCCQALWESVNLLRRLRGLVE